MEKFPLIVRKRNDRRVNRGAGRVRAESSLSFKPLDKTSYVPMYAQIQTQLLEMIRAGRLSTGDSLPSEEELSRAFGVSRMTSRQALQLLKSQGHAARHRGKGTFVTQPKVEKDIAHLAGFTAEMRQLGMKPSSQVLAAGIVSASGEVSEQLAVRPGGQAFRLRRLRLADGSPVAIEEIYLSLEKFPGIEKFDFSRRSLYQTLRTRYAIRFGMADEILEARSANSSEAKLLKIPPRSSLLVIARRLWSVDDEPVEVARSIYRGDRYRAVLRIPATTVE
jgi:GntR family transcriptional regulator